MTDDTARKQLVIDFMTLRSLIGWMGVSLPIVVYLGNWLIFTNRVAVCLLPGGNVPYSLSAYYYTHMRGLFTGAFWAIGVFLVAYKGRVKWDNWITSAAGISAIGIATFPTKPPATFLAMQRASCGPEVPVLYQSSPNQTAIGIVHMTALFILIGTLFAMTVRFIKDTTEDWEEVHRKRHKIIYKASAAGIAIGGLGAIAQNFLSDPVKAATSWLFWAEIVAIFSFGVAWFVKGDALNTSIRYVKKRLGIQGAVNTTPAQPPA